MDGYFYDEGALTQAADYLRGGVADLDLIASDMPDAVDAGFSSEVVGAALVRVTKGCVALAQIGDGIADKLHAANGSYADIENTNAGRMRYEGQKSEDSVKTLDQIDRERQNSEAAYPFEHSPTPAKTQPKPQAAEPGDVPEPPPPR